MRDILFRAKPKYSEEWVYGVPVPVVRDGRITSEIELLAFVDYDCPAGYNGETGYEGFAVEADTIGQFIGLTDRNGQKIFEGDIVQWHNQFYPICWNDKYARFAVKPEGAVFAVIPFDQGEVVGNIYDNPDLADGIMTLRSAVCTVELTEELTEKLKDLFAACAGNEDKEDDEE